MADAEKTTDHDTIKAWAEARGGEPAAVADTLSDGKKGAILRIRFQDEDDLEAIAWDEFFEIFEENELAVLLQDETAAGDESRFARFVSR